MKKQKQRLAVVRGEGIYKDEAYVVLCDNRGPMMENPELSWNGPNDWYAEEPILELCYEGFAKHGTTLLPSEWTYIKVEEVE